MKQYRDVRMNDIIVPSGQSREFTVVSEPERVGGPYAGNSMAPFRRRFEVSFDDRWGSGTTVFDIEEHFYVNIVATVQSRLLERLAWKKQRCLDTIEVLEQVEGTVEKVAEFRQQLASVEAEIEKERTNVG